MTELDGLPRPEASPRFRDELHERLREEAREPVWRPRRPGTLALAYLGSGAALLTLAALGLLDVGPLA